MGKPEDTPVGDCAGTVIVLGAGPCGLGAATRLTELGYSDWKVVDMNNDVGGLANTVVDEKGFSWDNGIHIVFSHYDYFDQVITASVPEFLHHVREAWVRMRNRWIPYPFQNNIQRLDNDDLLECLDGLVDRLSHPCSEKPKNFEEWLVGAFGEGLCNVFMRPYNNKVWAYPPEKLNVEWMGERVPVIDLKRILRNVVTKKDDLGWGPNNTFRYPLHGGTGALWKGIFSNLDKNRFCMNTTIETIDVKTKTIHYKGGNSEHYDKIFSTLPIDILVLYILRGVPETEHNEMKEVVAKFRHTTTHVVGIGVKGEMPADLEGKAWLYLPEPETVCHRAGFLSSLSPKMVPEGCYSLLFETGESEDRPVNSETNLADVIAVAIKEGMIDLSKHKIISTYYHRVEVAYPTPFLGRDELLVKLHTFLAKFDIKSRGRFGGWKYEAANMDHSFMQGVEGIESIVNRDGPFAEELTYLQTDKVNQGRSNVQFSGWKSGC